jgi:hypothetical protein
VIGSALFLSSQAPATAAGAAFAAGTLVFFFLSVYHGLFGYTEHLRGGWQEAAGGLEVAALVVLVPLLAVQLRERQSHA